MAEMASKRARGHSAERQLQGKLRDVCNELDLVCLKLKAVMVPLLENVSEDHTKEGLLSIAADYVSEVGKINEQLSALAGFTTT